MRACIWCNREITIKLSITDILMFTRLEPSNFCEKCLSKFDKIKPETCCPHCCRKQETAEGCLDCLRWKKVYPDFDLNHHAAFVYDNFGKEWMERFKFTGDIRIGNMVSKEIDRSVRQFKSIDKIVPIPISDSSMKKRGFNQTEILLNMAEVKFLPLLNHSGLGEKQSAKTRRERMDTKQPFWVKELEADLIKRQQVLLIDDVYTTGRTMLYGVECLMENGAAGVQTFSLFR